MTSQIQLADPIPFPACSLPEFSAFADEHEPLYEPSKHLSLTPPPAVVLLDGTVTSTAPEVTAVRPKSQLAFTEPFQLLSDEGVRVLRAIIEREAKHIVQSERAQNTLRHLGYRSRWVRDFNQCPKVLEFVSKLAGESLMAHSMVSNYSHCNIGRPGHSQIVDQWHADSVPFVVVILLSDMSGATGGELQLIRGKTPQEAFELLARTRNAVPPEHLLTVRYPRPGAAVFMQGADVVHHVTAVGAAREPRITVVNSFMSRNPFVPDCTRHDTFKEERTGDFEFARHRAWRAARQLDALINLNRWPTTDELVQRLTTVEREVREARQLLQGEASDRLGYFNETTMTMTGYPSYREPNFARP